MFKKDKTVIDLQAKVEELEQKLGDKKFFHNETQELLWAKETLPSDFIHFTQKNSSDKVENYIKRKIDIIDVYQEENRKCQLVVADFIGSATTYVVEESLKEIKKRLGIFYGDKTKLIN